MRLSIPTSACRLATLLVALGGTTLACTKPGGEEPGVAAEEAAVSRPPTEADVRIFVNGQPLAAETVQLLQRAYPVAIPPGRYWYDPISGAWGREGEPIGGMMVAGLALGGPLEATASSGTSGVFINGRQITGGEAAFIERLCMQPVVPGRYWILSNGIGGFEGGPAFFNLAQCLGVPQQNSGPRTMSRTFCDANGACTTTGILGSILTTP